MTRRRDFWVGLGVGTAAAWAVLLPQLVGANNAEDRLREDRSVLLDDQARLVKACTWFVDGSVACPAGTNKVADAATGHSTPDDAEHGLAGNRARSSGLSESPRPDGPAPYPRVGPRRST